MRLHIKPGKVTCAGVVAIFLVMPSSIWKGPDPKVAPVSKVKIETVKNGSEPDGARVKFRTITR